MIEKERKNLATLAGLEEYMSVHGGMVWDEQTETLQRITARAQMASSVRIQTHTDSSHPMTSDRN